MYAIRCHFARTSPYHALKVVRSKCGSLSYSSSKSMSWYSMKFWQQSTGGYCTVLDKRDELVRIPLLSKITMYHSNRELLLPVYVLGIIFAIMSLEEGYYRSLLPRCFLCAVLQSKSLQIATKRFCNKPFDSWIQYASNIQSEVLCYGLKSGSDDAKL